MRCFLTGYGACSKGSSREHYLSRSLLDRISPVRPSIDVLGLSWIERDAFISVGKSSLVARILCKHHNESLSSLDASASAFIDAIASADANLRSVSSTDARDTINGRSLERWALKVLLGMLASGQFRAVKGKKLKPRELCFDLLVNPGKVWPSSWGLCFPIPRESVHHSASFEARTMSNPISGEVWALAMALNGIAMTLVMGVPDEPNFFGILRPASVRLENDRSSRIIAMNWYPEVCGEDYRLLLSDAYSGHPPGHPLAAVGDLQTGGNCLA